MMMIIGQINVIELNNSGNERVEFTRKTCAWAKKYMYFA